MASGAFRSTAIDRLLRFQARKFGLSLPPTQLVVEGHRAEEIALAGSLHLDDVGAHVGEKLGAERPLQEVAEIEDGDVRESLFGHGEVSGVRARLCRHRSRSRPIVAAGSRPSISASRMMAEPSVWKAMYPAWRGRTQASSTVASVAL